MMSVLSQKYCILKISFNVFQIMLDSFELLLPNTSTNPFLFDSEIKTNKYIQDSLDTKRNTDRGS